MIRNRTILSVAHLWETDGGGDMAPSGFVVPTADPSGCDTKETGLWGGWLWQPLHDYRDTTCSVPMAPNA